MYLRILKAIDEEVVDRDIVRSPQVNTVCWIATILANALFPQNFRDFPFSLS